MQQIDIQNTNNYFFIGIAGVGMSAIAQYLVGIGKNISGSDRQFSNDKKNLRQEKLEACGIKCFPQDTTGLNTDIELVVISTAIEPTVPEYKKALEMGIKIAMRSDLLASISLTKKTIAVAGTSGKSTVAAMIFHILNYAGRKPSIITGAGLVSLQKQGKIGNAVAGKGRYLVIEADESDGSLVKYKPEIGVILNIDKDHKEISELNEIFQIFADNSKKLIVNSSQENSNKFSRNKNINFCYDSDCGYKIYSLKKNKLFVSFNINDYHFETKLLGKHNAENVAAASAVCNHLGVSLETCAEAIRNYEGINRRHQIIGEKNGIIVIDDYAHNPAKIKASIHACQLEGSRVFAWFQPHGFAPTRFLKNEFIAEISDVLRENDEIYMSEIYYAGGTTTKDISANDLILGIQKNNKKAYFIENRNDLLGNLESKLQNGDIVLLMGARDPSLKQFANDFYFNLKV